jgi:hypothetical protein
MATASDPGVVLESPGKDRPAANADLQEVIVDSSERPREGGEPLQDGVARPPRAFDYVELPLGVAVSTPCSLWEGGLFDVSEHTDVTLHTAWYSPFSTFDTLPECHCHLVVKFSHVETFEAFSVLAVAIKAEV